MSNSLPNTQTLAIDGLSIRFGQTLALDDVSLSVQPGERVALLGHNGAGKSTLFKTVLGFLPPVAGTVQVAGGLPGSDIARSAVSYLPEQVAFARALTGSEVIAYFASLKSWPVKDALELLEIVGISEARDRRIGTYSKGMRQRLGLAQALIGNPQLMLLDEPTSGLDPLSRLEFYDIINAKAAKGAAVLLSSHSLTEVEARTDRVIILSKGRLVAEGSIAALTSQARLPIHVRIRAQAEHADQVHARIGGERINGQSVTLSCEQSGKVDMLARIAALGDIVIDFEFSNPDLDDIYKHYSKRLPAGEHP